MSSYYDKEKDDLLDAFDDTVNGPRDLDWIDDIEFNERGNYVALPSFFDRNDYLLMKDFIANRSSADQEIALSKAIIGHGAFRHFKKLLYQFGLEEDWYRFILNKNQK